MLAADAVIFASVFLGELLALRLRKVFVGESHRHAVELLRSRHEIAVELAQQRRLGGTFDRIVADDAAHGTERHPISARQQQRNPFTVIDHVVKRRRTLHTPQQETVAAFGIEQRRIDDRLRLGRHLLQINAPGIAADEPARNLHFRRLTAAQDHGRRQRNEKRLLTHLMTFSRLECTKIAILHKIRHFISWNCDAEHCFS